MQLKEISQLAISTRLNSMPRLAKAPWQTSSGVWTVPELI
jgi:hypothetical protein